MSQIADAAELPHINVFDMAVAVMENKRIGSTQVSTVEIPAVLPIAFKRHDPERIQISHNSLFWHHSGAAKEERDIYVVFVDFFSSPGVIVVVVA